MPRNRLKTLVVAGCLALECGGCRTCLVESFDHVRDRRPWTRREACATIPPENPQVSSDQNRSIAPSTSPSPASPESSEYLGQDAPPAESALQEESGDSTQAAQMQAAAELKKLGGRISTDAHGVVTGIDLAQTATTDTDLKLLKDCPGLLELNLRGTLIGDAGLETLSAASQLEFLGLTGTMVTDEGLTHLQQLGRLRFLTLGHTAVTDKGLSALAGCRQLEGLNIKATAVTAAGLVALQSRLPNCRIVSDVTATTTIDSSDLPLPMKEESSTATEANNVPLPPATDSDPSTERLFDPFVPVEPPLSPDPFAEPATEPGALPPAPSAGRAPRSTRRPVAAGGPGQRLEHVLAGSLGDPSVLRAIAQSYASRGEWDAASTVLRAAVEAAPNDHDLQFELGVAEARNGDYVSALMHLQQCGSLAVAHYNLGVLMHEAGLAQASVLAFRSALRYDPQLHEARVWLAQIAPGQAQAAAMANGRKPAMIGGPIITPVEAQQPEPAKPEAASNAAGIIARPSSLQAAVRERQTKLVKPAR